MGNKITKWIELHIPSGPSGLLQFPVPNHAPTITTTQQPAEYHSLYLKIGFRFSNGLLGIEMKAFGRKMQRKCFSSLGCNAPVFCWTKATINYQKKLGLSCNLCQLIIKGTELKQVRSAICFTSYKYVIFTMQKFYVRKIAN